MSNRGKRTATTRVVIRAGSKPKKTPQQALPQKTKKKKKPPASASFTKRAVNNSLSRTGSGNGSGGGAAAGAGNKKKAGQKAKGKAIFSRLGPKVPQSSLAAAGAAARARAIELSSNQLDYIDKMKSEVVFLREQMKLQKQINILRAQVQRCLLYTSPSPRDRG